MGEFARSTSVENVIIIWYILVLMYFRCPFLFQRPLPQVREQTCSTLAAHGLKEDFITMSIRQGDKKTEENFQFASMQQYIDAAEQSIPVHFNGKMPTIFVATDDCSVLGELRQLRPEWKFVR